MAEPPIRISCHSPQKTTAWHIYNISRTLQNPHVMYSDDGGATWDYGGQITKQAPNAPSSNYVNGYFKYTSNGVDRIDFVATEFHPRDYNTSIYHGYIKDGKIFDSTGNVIDGDIFDTKTTFNANNLPAPTDLTPVFQAGADANSRAWMSDIQSYADGSVSVLFKARAGAYGSSSAGAADQRVWYARLDPQTKHWTTIQIARAGGALFPGQETDYTGLGALDPNNPSVLYISTNVDPTTSTPLAHHEIFKGVTLDKGLNWTWLAITENSSYENLRPIIPKWNGENTALLWWRGTMSSSQNFDTAVVGILDRRAERVGRVSYVEATLANTTLTNGAPLVTTGPSPSAGSADGSWHRLTDAGNGGSVFAADELGVEDTPAIRTTASGVAPGTYDVFAFFWSDVAQDWQIQAGLSANNLMTFRPRGSQQADQEQFNSPLLLDEGNRALYRGYVGRVEISQGEAIQVFIDDSTGSGTQRVWYDGIGFALVSPVLTGDYNDDGVVDGNDVLVWQRNLGTANVLSNNPIGGPVTLEQLNQWRLHFGATSAVQTLSAKVPEPRGILLTIVAILINMSLRRAA